MIIKAGTLEIVEGCNGFYLYGQELGTHETVCLGCLGDGSDGEPILSDMSLDEWAEAYDFLVVA